MGEQAKPPRRAGIREVAAAAGVSESTVSNVLNNPQVVKPETRERVEQAFTQVGFVRNRAAGQLRGAPSAVVGCVLLDAANTFYAEVARGVENRLTEAGCLHLLCSTDVNADRERRYLRMLEEQGVRAVIVNPVVQELDELVALTRRGTPVVLLDHPQSGADLCAVTVDNVAGGQLAAEHLLNLGHRRIVFLRPSVLVSTIRQRREGAELACVSAGTDPRRVLVDVRVPPARVDAVDDAVIAHILAIRPQPTAVLCFNDFVAVSLLRGLRRRGLAVPQDMSVVGYDDVHFASELFPALTTVRQPTYDLGRSAAELALSEHEPRHSHRELVFRLQLMSRESTAAPRS